MVEDFCAASGALFIADEVIAFRAGFGGLQGERGFTPHLTTLGKIIGGGFPLAAIAGRADIMAHFDKGRVGAEGFTMQIGTLSGNPVAAVAGLKTMEILRRPGMYEAMAAKGQAIMDAYAEHLGAAGIAHQIVGEPWLFDCVFSERAVTDYRPSTGSCPRCGDALDLASVKRDGVWYCGTACADGHAQSASEGPAVPQPWLTPRPRRFHARRGPKELKSTRPGS